MSHSTGIACQKVGLKTIRTSASEIELHASAQASSNASNVGALTAPCLKRHYIKLCTLYARARTRVNWSLVVSFEEHIVARLANYQKTVPIST
jgi:hypothetical protein